MKTRKLAFAPLIAVLSVLFLSLALNGKASASRPDGTMPIQVGFNPGGGGGIKIHAINDGGQYTMTVTMNADVVDDENVPVSYSNLSGPATVTIPAGTNNGSITVTTTGNSGDLASATASNENGQASGSFTIP